MDISNRPILRLASAREAMQSHYDAIVIGSGYGGAIAASRLSRVRRADGTALSVCVLERGEELQPGEYPDTPAKAAAAMQVDLPHGHVGKHTALYDFRVNDELNAFIGCGLGGGSLINANVALEPDPRVFSDPAWPAAFRADVDLGLRAGYDRAVEMLRPAPYPEARLPLSKLRGLERMGEALGQTTVRPPINVHFGEAHVNHVGVVQLPCTDCGDCVSGCNVSAKNTLLMNYLPDAVNHGASIFTCIGVRALERDAAGGGWKVWFRILDTGAEKFDAPESFITSDRVFLGAGTLGSTEILLRSKLRGLPLSERVGARCSGNGDVLAFVYGSDSPLHPVGFGLHPTHDERRVGPCITGLVDLRSTDDFASGTVIEEGSFPGALAIALPGLMAVSAALGAVTHDGQLRPDRALREAESLLLGAYHGAVDRTEVLLVMSHDEGNGQMVLEDDRLRIRWPGLSDERVFNRIEDQLMTGARAIDGVLVKNPAWTELLGRRLITVHALGGCGMGETSDTGVIDHVCRVFDPGGGVHQGLYVCDGAAMPRPLGVNPLLTISAVAERALALAAKAEGWTIDYALPSISRPRSVASAAAQPVGIQFTETMHGFVWNGGEDYASAAELGRAKGGTCAFTLTMTADDLDAMLADPEHRASLAGTVQCSLFSDQPLAVTSGEFRLLALDTSAMRTRRMVYSFTMTGADGTQYHFAGFKRVHDDPGPDLWTDTTTLYVDITRNGSAVAQGILRIAPADLLVQMTTLRALRAPTIMAALEAKAKFGKFFAGALADTFIGLPRRTPSVWPPAAHESGTLRTRRALRLPAPEVHVLRTEGVDLRLTRFNAGSKGPVILAHGLGVSSRIFTHDTIDTNLAEFLAAAGYDLWLLDFRASIDLPSAHSEFSGDEIARLDYPAAVDAVRRLTGSDTVQIVAHCFGASTLFMALAAGLSHVRSAVFSQVAGHVSAPLLNEIRAGLFLPSALGLLGVDELDADVSRNPGLLERLYDQALRINPALGHDQHCDSATCHRISFMYAPLYRHEQLNASTHATLGELFGTANLRSLRHLSAMVRQGKVVAFDDDNAYLPEDAVALQSRLSNFAFPIRFIHGALNECFLPESTARTLQALSEANPEISYDRVVIDGYGHIDCIFGANAARDVYPHIVEHLEKNGGTR